MHRLNVLHSLPLVELPRLRSDSQLQRLPEVLVKLADPFEEDLLDKG